jgi:hypothetical protein
VLGYRATLGRAELEWEAVPYPAESVGTTQALTTEDEHGAHVFLYVPDLSVETGWSTHRVPERKSERREQRGIGFGR